ncbi:hypothetical protein ACFLV7_05590 [Chloroflexota bacterium]
MKLKKVVITILAVMFISSTACGGTDLSGNDPLENTPWMLMAYRKTRPIPGTIITTAFKDGNMRVSAGCNS